MTFNFDNFKADIKLPKFPKTFLELCLKNMFSIGTEEQKAAARQAKAEEIISAAKDLDKQLEVFIADNYKQYLTRSRNGIRYYNVPTADEFNKILDFVMSSDVVNVVWGKSAAIQMKQMMGSTPYAIPGHGIFVCEENINKMLDALTDPEEFLRAKDFILAHEQGHIRDFESQGVTSFLDYLTIYKFDSYNPEQWTMEGEYKAEAYAYRYTQEDVTFGVMLRGLIGKATSEQMVDSLELTVEEGFQVFANEEERQMAIELVNRTQLQFTRDSFIKSVSDTIIDKLMEGEVA